MKMASILSYQAVQMGKFMFLLVNDSNSSSGTTRMASILSYQFAQMGKFL
jgi:hypothetical protein